MLYSNKEPRVHHVLATLKGLPVFDMVINETPHGCFLKIYEALHRRNIFYDRIIVE